MYRQLNTGFQRSIERWFSRPNVPKKAVMQLFGGNVALGTSVGIVRKENEDVLAFVRVPAQASSLPFFVTVLCDGMGGMSQGAACASLAVSSFLSSLLTTPSSWDTRLERAVMASNMAVFEKFHGNGGATLSAVVVTSGGHAHGVNVGDSRIWQICGERKVEQVTVDDTLAGQLSNSNGPAHYPPEYAQLVQYVGMGEGLQPHAIRVAAETEGIIITSDGAHTISKDLFGAIVAQAKTPKTLVERMISLSEWIGGKDNASVICVMVRNLTPVPSMPVLDEGIDVWDSFGQLELLDLRQPQVVLPEEPSKEENEESAAEPSGIQASEKQGKGTDRRKNRKKAFKRAGDNKRGKESADKAGARPELKIDYIFDGDK